MIKESFKKVNKIIDAISQSHLEFYLESCFLVGIFVFPLKVNNWWILLASGPLYITVLTLSGGGFLT